MRANNRLQFLTKIRDIATQRGFHDSAKPTDSATSRILKTGLLAASSNSIRHSPSCFRLCATPLKRSAQIRRISLHAASWFSNSIPWTEAPE
jgi:hypothetical protein